MSVTLPDAIAPPALKSCPPAAQPAQPVPPSPQATTDAIETIWCDADHLIRQMQYLKTDQAQNYRLLLDITAIDERQRTHRPHPNCADFTLLYHVLRPTDGKQLRVKIPLTQDALIAPTLCAVFPNANWYEREIWDMFGIRFAGHDNLRRILMPESWQGHPLRKDHYSRATERGPFVMQAATEQAEQYALRDSPALAGMIDDADDDPETMIINLGPNHPSLHGVLRLVVKLRGEEIIDVVPEIGFHHRGAEKIGERQSWHSFIPYTDRIDYVAGVMNNFPYVMGVEQLAGITVPARAQMIRIMLAEIFRIISHLVFFGTMVQDVGQLSPVFYVFTDRERALELIEMICGFRMHPSFFRIGGVAADLPQGWDGKVREFLAYLPKRLDEYQSMVMRNRIFKARTIGIGEYSAAEALDWGVTGPGLRATGIAFDYRKIHPYSGYDQLAFDIPIAQRGDCYNRVQLRLDEMRESLRIISQCLEQMPPGPVKSNHPLAMPMPREAVLHDIDTLIPHFLNATWGAVIPPGEVSTTIEATKGLNTYHLVSDGTTQPYRVRIRTPSFAHLQIIPAISRGAYLADLIAIIGSIDFVMADVDR
ncbi:MULTISPECIES: NADH-quinone oxidoreductase subunit C/D [Acidiphilium]|uniref:NADH-quinone oxidoreductase subunit D n=1 Tax=Acidiphilium rubrum TaxID=526 RepID=A0A8G2CHG6_ACIRU|nr:NADH dehydrogenase subunit C /NADH dehydrogenase subunit D [Acidiphilium rubrum]